MWMNIPRLSMCFFYSDLRLYGTFNAGRKSTPCIHHFSSGDQPRFSTVWAQGADGRAKLPFCDRKPGIWKDKAGPCGYGGRQPPSQPFVVLWARNHGIQRAEVLSNWDKPQQVGIWTSLDSRRASSSHEHDQKASCLICWHIYVLYIYIYISIFHMFIVHYTHL